MLDSMNNAPVNLSLNPSQQLDSQAGMSSVPQRTVDEGIADSTSTALDSSSHALWAPYQQSGAGRGSRQGLPTPVAEAGEEEGSASERRSSGGGGGGGASLRSELSWRVLWRNA